MPIRIKDSASGVISTSTPAEDQQLVRYNGTAGTSIEPSPIVVTDLAEFERVGSGSVSLFADADTTSITIGSSSITVTLNGSTVNVGTVGETTNIKGDTVTVGDSSAVGSQTTINGETINIGESGSTINMIGDVNNQQVTNLNVTDKLITLNDGGAAGSGNAVGIEVEEDSSATGYIKTKSDRNGWEVKAPNQTGIATIEVDSDAFTVDKTIVKGPTSGSDNRLLRSDGTNGRLIQESGITIDDNDNVSGVGTITASSSGAADTLDISNSGTGSALSISHSGAGYSIDANNGVRLTGLTASRALTTNASQELEVSATTNTELGYVSGVTSAIQTQLDQKSTDLTTHINDTSDAHASSAISYDNTTSGLTATDVKAALDEIDAKADTNAGDISTNAGDISTNAGNISTNATNLSTHISDTSTHGVTGDILGTTDAQTVTNKTIDADNNTISNLAHGAEVDNPSSGVHGVTGSVVGTTDSQTLTNKTLTSPVINGGSYDGGTASDTNKIVLPSDTKANLDADTREEARIVWASDEDKLYVDNGTNLVLPEASASFTTVTKSSNATLSTSGEDIVLGDTTSGDVTLTLPAASGNGGLRYSIIKSVAANTLIVDGNSTETINGELTFVMESIYDAVQIVCDGTNWKIENNDTVVAARYSSDAGQTITSSTLATVVYEDVQSALGGDTHSAYNTSTGVYTIPIPGWYHIVGNIGSTLNVTAGDILGVYVAIDGTRYTSDVREYQTISAAITEGLQVSGTFYCDEGAEVEIKLNNLTSNTIGLSAAAFYNNFSIVKVA